MSDIVEILSSDQVSESRAVINENFDNLNTDKLDKSSNLSELSNVETARANLGLENLQPTPDDDGFTIIGDVFVDGSLHPADDGGSNLGSSLTGWGIVYVTNLGAVDFGAGDVWLSHAAANTLEFRGASSGYFFDAPILSRGDNDLVLKTGNATTGTITIADGVNGNINVAPNGSGKLQQGGVNVALITDVPTQEVIEDYVGGMVSSNTETGIAVTYNDGTGKLDFDAQTAGDARYAPIAKGVTNGDTHDHSGGDGAQINHTTLSNIGTNTHAQIDTHIAFQQAIYKSADETVNNSDTLQNDDHLTFAVGTNEAWAINVMLIHDASSTADFKLKWNLPASATMKWIAYPDLGFAGLTEASTVVANGGGDERFLSYTGTVFTSGTAGNVTLQWAQNTATVENTKLLKGSYIIAHRLA